MRPDREGDVDKGWRLGGPWAFAGFVALWVAYIATVPFAGDRDGDFAHLWTGGRLVTTGQPLYSPAAQRGALEGDLGPLPDELWPARQDIVGAFFYPPPTALVYAPLGALPMRTAARAQAALTIALGLALSLLMSRLTRRRDTPLSISTTGLLLATAPPLFFSFVLGQNGAATLFVVVVSATLLVGGRDLWAGLAMGLLLCKPTWLLALGWIPLVMGRWRAVVGLALGVTGVVLASVLVLGPGPWQDYLALLPRLAELPKLPGYPLELQFNALSLTRRVWGVGALSDGLGWGLALTVLGATVWRMRTLRPLDALALATLAGTLLNPHLHHYDLAPTLLAEVVLLSTWRAHGRGGRVALALLVGAHHVSLGLISVLGVESWLPLPTWTLLALWAWLAFSRPRPGSSAARPARPAAAPAAG